MTRRRHPMPQSRVIVVIPDSPPNHPIELFRSWYAEAERAEAFDPSARAGAPADRDGAPSVRMMLLKAADATGFVFYTNLESRKAGEFERSGRAALCFHWRALRRQVRIEGRLARVGDAEADAYFATRPRGSQIAAWASDQSRPLAGRADLERRVAEVERRFAGRPVLRPPFWSGYRLSPTAVEFWQDRADRLHERLVYRLDGGRWTYGLLYP
jgi:pyridoxamine 5'-phosphate oxidase